MMTLKQTIRMACQAGLTAAAITSANIANATIVQFQTSLGEFEVNLYDQGTPETVANFLAYMEANTYSNTIMHRLVPGFVIQGGAYAFDENDAIKTSDALWSPINEPVYSNVKGTIAMAKLPNDQNSATNQWFINLADNSANLDTQNGGFTVFGEVIGDGMQVVNAIAALKPYKIDDSAFTSTPLRDYTTDDADDLKENPRNYLVLVENVVVIDAAEDTAAELNPTPNTLINSPPKKKKKGGSLDWIMVLCFGLISTAGLASRNKRA